jgi:hypothetical protein
VEVTSTSSAALQFRKLPPDVVSLSLVFNFQGATSKVALADGPILVDNIRYCYAAGVSPAGLV